ncbi:MAG: hypothetical protein AB1830_04075 [Pseudomonadota bacterium]
MIAVVNFPKKRVGPFMSEALVTGFPDAEGSILLVLSERTGRSGARLVQRQRQDSSWWQRFVARVELFPS